MLSCSLWFSAPIFFGYVVVLRGWCRTAPPAPYTRPAHLLSRPPPIQNSVQKTISCNSTSNAPDDGRMYPKHVELRIHQ